MNNQELKSQVEITLQNWKDTEDAYNEVQTQAYKDLMDEAEAKHLEAVKAYRG